MANQVNWGMPELRSPGPEIASISGLLGSIADAREKKRQFEVEQARLRAADEQQARHQQALEEYNRQNLQQQAEHQQQTLAQARDLATMKAKQGMQKDANAHMGDVHKLIDTGDMAGAQALGGQYGMDVSRDQGLIDSRATDARVQRGQQDAGAMDAMRGIGMLPGVPDQAVDSAAQGEGVSNTDEELNPRQAPAQIKMPVGSVLDYDPVSTRQASRKEVGRLQGQFMETEQANMAQSPNWEKAARTIGNQMAGEGYKGDPYKEVAALAQHLDDEDNKLKAAGMKQEPRPPSPQGDQRINQAAKKVLNSEVEKFSAQSGMRDLKKAYGQTIKADRLTEAGTGEGEAAAIDEFIKTARGGMVTGQSLGFSMAHLGGALTRLETAWDTLKTGQFSEQAMDNLTKSLEAAREGIKEEVEGIRQAFVSGFYSGGANDELKTNLDDHYDRLFSQFGYKAERQQGATGITPTGKRIGGGASAAPPAGGGTLARLPVGSGDMAVVPSGRLPTAAEAAGTGTKGVAGADPALAAELRALAKQVYEQRQQRRQQGGTH